VRKLWSVFFSCSFFFSSLFSSLSIDPFRVVVCPPLCLFELISDIYASLFYVYDLVRTLPLCIYLGIKGFLPTVYITRPANERALLLFITQVA